ncbi:hypothetical protein SK128_023457 [Halocaridina rubra]|uniref:Uncharacterized protein n=1 Tax=Halocaridina rubra TaxID=373956 RepID=A0AAN8XM83_HALRR
MLNQEPLLVKSGQVDDNSVESPDDSKGNAREAPDGEESSKTSSNRSHTMIRQGTFNVNGQDSVATVHATLDGHLARVNKVHQFNDE